MNLETVTVTELAQSLKLRPDTVYRMARRGDIPGFKVGSEWRFQPEVVLAHLTAESDPWAQSRTSRNRRRVA